MRPSIGITIALAAGLALLPLSGCGQSQTASSQNTGSSNATASSSDGDGVHDYQLTESYSYQGVTFLGDPSWTISQPKPYNYYVKIDMPKNSHVSIQSALHGQTATLEGAFKEYFRADNTTTQTNTWTKNGVTYCSGYYETSGNPIYLLSGSEDASGKGFLLSMTFETDNWTEDQAKSLFDAIVATVEYDPSQTDMDYHEAFASNQGTATSTQGNTSSNASSSSSSTNASSESTSQTATTYGPGTLKVGTDIPAGEYKVTSTRSNGEGYWAIRDSSGTNSNILANDAFTGSSYATVEDGQYFELSGAIATPAE